MKKGGFAPFLYISIKINNKAMGAQQFCETSQTSQNFNWIAVSALVISLISLLFSIFTRWKSSKSTRKIGRPNIRVDYDNRLQSQDSSDRRYSISVNLINESKFQIKIKSIRFNTNGQSTSEINIAYTNDWLQPDESRNYDWIIDVNANKNMKNNLLLKVESESGALYFAKMDLSGINTGIAFQGKME